MTGVTTDDSLRLAFPLEAPPEKVWRALTVKAYLERWLLPVQEGEGLIFAGGADGLAERIEADIIGADPPCRLSWLWRERGEGAHGDGIVTFTLSPMEGGGTWLTIEQRAIRTPIPEPANSNTTVALAA